MKVIYNLKNAIATFDDGKIRLQPRGEPDDHKAITDAQAQLPQVVNAAIGNRVRLVSVAENTAGTVAPQKEKAVSVLPPKPEPKVVPPVVEEKSRREEDATPVAPVSETIATAIEAVVDDVADTTDEHATESTEKDSTDRKHGKNKSRRR